MRFERLDLNLLVALDALLTEKSVSVAADRIHLSQSATSSALGRLREYFDDDLLVLKGRKMVLTARGEELSEPVRNVLHMVRTTITEAPEFDPASSDRTITIMATDYSTEVVLSPALQEISKTAPNLKFIIRPVSEDPTRVLEHGEVDLVVSIDVALAKEHPYEMLFQDNYVVLGWSENPLITDGIDEQTYFNMGHITTGFASKNRQPAFEEWFLRNHAMPRRIEVTAPTFMSVPFLLIGTNRIATIQKRLASHLASKLPLKIMPTPFEIAPIRQAVQWHRSNSKDPCLAWLVQKMKDAVSDESELTPIDAANNEEYTEFPYLPALK